MTPETTKIELNPKAQKLLDELISDYNNRLGPDDYKGYQQDDRSAYIYNLFRGKYAFSAVLFRELYDYLDKNKK